MANQYPKARKAWQRQDAAKVMALLKRGYEKHEVALHVGRPPNSISTMLAGYGTSVTELQAEVDKKAALDLPPLPPYKADLPMLQGVQEPLTKLEQAPTVNLLDAVVTDPQQKAASNE